MRFRNNIARPSTAVKDAAHAYAAFRASAGRGLASEVLYQRLLVDRNKTWAKKIAELLKGSNTVLIAGGAGHFAGPDSVLVQLQALGIKAERVQ